MSHAERDSSLPGQLAREPFTRARARAFDADAQARLGVPGDVLMENAGAAVARAALGFSRARGLGRAVFVCGTGNNGGDGFVAARQLLGSLALEVFLVGDRLRVGGDALANLLRLERSGQPVCELSTAKALREALGEPALVVDALFGTGLDRPVEGLARRTIELVNASGAPVLSVDVPSGLDADTGAVLGAAVAASRTITFVSRKVGFDRGEGPRLAGAVEIVGIGVPVEAPGAP